MKPLEGALNTTRTPTATRNVEAGSGGFSQRAVHQRPRWAGVATRYYDAEMIRYLQYLVPPGQSVLEIGCQDGSILARLGASRGVGLDRSALSGDSFRAEGPFDVIVLRHVLEFAQDIQGVIDQLRPHCHAGTRLIVITHNFLWAPILSLLQRMRLKRTAGQYAWLTINDLDHLLTYASWDVIRREYRTVLPVWIPGLSWVANRVLGKLPGIWKLGVDQWIVARPLQLIRREELPSVSVIIPCRNERGTIRSIVQRTPRMGRRMELIFVEGHSTDGTLEELHAVKRACPDHDITVLVQQGQGKGDAVRLGMEAAVGDIVIILDADLSVEPEALPQFVEVLLQGHCELVLGSRLVYPMESRAMQPLNMAANMLFGQGMSFVLGQQVKDTLCGTKALWRRDYGRITSQRRFFGLNDPFGDFDLILGAAKLSLKIREIPVPYRERTYGTTNIHRWRHGFLLWVMLMRALIKVKVQ